MARVLGAVDMFKGDEVAGEHFTSLYLNAIFEQVHFTQAC